MRTTLRCWPTMGLLLLKLRSIVSNSGVMSPRDSRHLRGGTAADMIEGDEAQPFTRGADDDTAEDGLGNDGEVGDVVASAQHQYQYQYGTR